MRWEISSDFRKELMLNSCLFSNSKAALEINLKYYKQKEEKTKMCSLSPLS